MITTTWNWIIRTIRLERSQTKRKNDFDMLRMGKLRFVDFIKIHLKDMVSRIKVSRIEIEQKIKQPIHWHIFLPSY
jgi:hypothetical protein